MRSDELRRALRDIPGYAEAERRALPGKAVALAVARFRAEHGLTQAELAQRIGSSQPVIARIESGRRPPNVKILNQIADAFGLTWKPVFERHADWAATSETQHARQPASEATIRSRRDLQPWAASAEANWIHVAFRLADVKQYVATSRQVANAALVIRETSAYYGEDEPEGEFDVIRLGSGSLVPVKRTDARRPRGPAKRQSSLPITS